MCLLVIGEILGLFVNTLTVDDNYSVCYRENIPQTIQTEIPKKKFFPKIVPTFLKATLNFQHFRNKDDHYAA